MTDKPEMTKAREIVTEWMGMFDPPPQIDFQQIEFLQQSIASVLADLGASSSSGSPVGWGDDYPKDQS
jgi:hypothetical protein